MEIFDNDVFTLNPDLTWESIDTPLAKITIIEDFYKDFEAVHRELLKLAASTTFCHKPGEILDYRKSYAGNMRGTLAPYFSQYNDVVADIIGWDGEVYSERAVLINCNRLQCDKHKDHWHNVHRDPKKLGWTDRVSTVVMLNNHYEEGEGINFYYEHDFPWSLWLPKESVERLHFVQGKANRAILFSPNLWHGPALETDQFKSEYRYTQVIFSDMR